MALKSVSGGAAVGACSTHRKDIKHRIGTEKQLLDISGSTPRIVRSICSSLDQFVVFTEATLSSKSMGILNESRGLLFAEVRKTDIYDLTSTGTTIKWPGLRDKWHCQAVEAAHFMPSKWRDCYPSSLRTYSVSGWSSTQSGQGTGRMSPPGHSA